MHLWHQVVEDAHPALWVVLIDVVLEGAEAQLVSIFEVTIVFSMLLDCIVRQMHEGIVYILEVDTELTGRGPQVSLLEEEELLVLIQEHPDTNVELALVDQQWPLDVLLDDERVVLDLVISSGLLARG